MNVICEHCQTKLTIPDSKIPKDRATKVKCPKCKGAIHIPAAAPSAGSATGAEEGLQTGTSALICIGQDQMQHQVQTLVKDAGFNASAAPSAKDALKKLEYHIFPLVVVDDTFDNNKGFDRIIKKFNTIDTSLRRKMCLVYISEKIATGDDMSALRFSVNGVVNQDDMGRFDTILNQVVSDHRNMYTVYNESLKSAGRI